jgi:hypothetical protein
MKMRGKFAVKIGNPYTDIRRCIGQTGCELNRERWNSRRPHIVILFVAWQAAGDVYILEINLL